VLAHRHPKRNRTAIGSGFGLLTIAGEDAGGSRGAVVKSG
jgi:hypothetical protein